MQWKDFFGGQFTLGTLKYWSDYADCGETEISEANGWFFARSGDADSWELRCSHEGLGFSFEIRLDFTENGVDLLIPKCGIKEGANRLHSLWLLPELFLRHEGDDGYYLLPQQSGVISRFAGKRDAAYEIGIYGNGYSECSMHAYAMVDGEAVEAAVMTCGFADAALRLETAHGPGKAYRLAPVYFFRYELNVRRQDMPCVNEDIALRFRTLPAAGRSGAAVLAQFYRDYRLEAGQIIPMAERAKANPVLAEALKSPEIRIRMGVKWPFPMTITEQTPENEPEVHVFCTYDQVKAIAAECRKQGVKHANFCLVGWAAKGHDGRYPQIMPVESAFGGESSLRSLIGEVQGIGYTITAHDNHYDAYAVSEDKFDDLLIRTQEGFPMKDGVWGGGQAYLLCPEAMYRKYTLRNLHAIHDLGFKGVHFTDCLSTTSLKVCWDPHHPNTKSGMIRWRTQILETIKEIFGGVQCEGPFDFAAGVLDRVLYVESGEQALRSRDYVDETVPLYELTYHGILMYNITGESINAVPGSRLYLKNLAYGGMPYFYFYRHFATKNYLPGTNTPVAGRFETRDYTLDDLGPEIAAIKRSADDYIDTLGHLQTCWMTEFRRLSPTLTRTDYSNGQSVYVNFADASAEADGAGVPANSFVLAPTPV